MKEKILIALCGMSPAVITETLYALNMKNKMPDKVIVITTTSGRRKIQEELFDSGIWDKFCREIEKNIEFGMSSHCIRLIPASDKNGDADDILTTNDNTYAADFILGTLREFTENPDTEIIFSIAGGRKTMSSLGALAMSLLGRKKDSLCHILVNPPFDNPLLTPKFFFPTADPLIHKLPNKNNVNSKNAVITLCDIPFPRLRYLFQNEFQRLPGNFNDTVNLANQRVSGRISPPDIKVIPERLECFINDQKIKLNCAEFTMYWMLAESAKKMLPPVYGQSSLQDEYTDFISKIEINIMPEIIHHRKSLQTKTQDDMRKIISALSAKIKNAVSIENGREAALPNISRGVYGISAPRDYIVIVL